MPQPYDYSLDVPSATEAFLGGIQMAQKLRENKLQAEAQQAKLDAVADAKRFSIAAQEVMKDPSPEAIDKLYSDHPTFGAEISDLSKRVDARDQRTYGSILKDAIVAKQRGASPVEISEIYKRGAAVAASSNRPDLENNFLQAAQMVTNDNVEDDFAARSLMRKFDPEGYKILYENQKDPFFAAGDKVYLRGPIMRLARDTEALASGKITDEQYDSTWGKGSANQYKTTGAVNAPKSYDVPTQKDIDDLSAGRISPGIFNQAFGPNAANYYKGGQTGSTTPSGTFQGQ